MTVTFLLRFLLGIASFAFLALGALLLWEGIDGEWVADPDGVLRHTREIWMLWVGGALLAWSLLGKFIVVPLLARRDSDPTRPERSNGEMIQGHGGRELYVEQHGAPGAPPIILTHGWSLDSTIWHYAKRDLGKQFRLTLWDLPGLGRSHRGKGAKLGLPDFAEQLRVLVARQGRPVVLVGHSIGGMTIQTLARDHPELFGQQVAGVVLLNTTWTNPLRTMILSKLAQALRKPVLEPMMRSTIWLAPLAWISSWQSYLSGSTHIAARFGFGRYVTRSQLEHAALLMTRNSPAVSARGDLAMFRWDSDMPFADLDVPVLVVAGDRDIVTKAEASHTIADSARRAQLETVSGVNHMGFLERADVYNALIADFASRLLTPNPVTSTASPRPPEAQGGVRLPIG